MSQFALKGKADAMLHAARSFHFDVNKLPPQTRYALRNADFSHTALNASSDGSIKGVTVRQVDDALTKAGITSMSHKIQIKIALLAQGIMKDLG